jgi:hypothetical protein
MQQFGLVFQILLLVAIVAGIFASWDRRTDNEHRDADRGGRRDTDAAAASIDAEEPVPH